MHLKSLLIISGIFWLLGCQPKNNNYIQKEESQIGSYPIAPVDIRNVKITDEFWLPIIKRVQEKTIAFGLKKCEEEGRFDNFLIAGKQQQGSVKGEMPFDDTDVYKIIEGASISLISAPNPDLEIVLDSLIKIIATGQEEDGYLTTWRTINPKDPPASWVKVEEGKRWESLDASHELYNSGHLYEAAYTHFIATGKRNFLDVALKNADLVLNTFGPGKIEAVPGHQIIETGLIKLYQLTGKTAYLNLAKYFLDHRGDRNHHPVITHMTEEYAQDHIPVIEQMEAVGHAVRAVYMYAAMTDIAVLMKDSAYNWATHAIWDNMVQKKMYITGGIGAVHEGEAFGKNYELPNLTSYNETCAAIGNVYWNQRLHNQSGQAAYFDVIERTLYNGLISGLSLDGEKFFYPNALESDGEYKFNRGSCTRQSWFDCSCCPTNLMRFIPSIPNLLYSTQADTAIYINLFASSFAQIQLGQKNVRIRQKTNYPWQGKVEVDIDTDENADFTLKIRIPSWARNIPIPSGPYEYVNAVASPVVVKINGEALAYDSEKGYCTITRTWQKGDKIELNLPMPVRRVRADERIEENIGKFALERGPIVYALEENDNRHIDEITVAANDEFGVVAAPDLLEGVQLIQNEKLKAIPYYTWSNRGIGKMKVWLPESK